MENSQPSRVRFGVFELDPKAGELRKHGIRIKLHDKPFQVLMALLERSGELVSRKELQERLWPGDTFVEFENGLNNAISRLREALGDSAESPRYIETIPRHGYRFIGTVESLADAPAASATVSFKTVAPSFRVFHSKWLLAAGVVAALGLALFAYRGTRAIRAPMDSVAVLPFTTASVGDGAQDEYLAFGMTEALIAELSQIRALKVISQTSVLQYKGARKPLPEIARELGVKAVVEGSVVREGNQLRITVQLIDASTDTHLWAQTYRRDISNVLVMQSEVAQAIAREVHVQLTPQEQAALATSKAVNPQAHEAYLKGRYFMRKAGDEEWKRAQKYLEEALRLDPDYAHAHAVLAEFYTANDLYSPDVAMPKARASARKALELDETLADAHVSLGAVNFFAERDWTGAEREFKRAIELDPGNVRARRWYSTFLAAMGRAQEAEVQIQKTLELDPVSISALENAAGAFVETRSFEKAIATARRIVELDPMDPRGYEYQGTSLALSGKYEEAAAALEKALERSENHPGYLCVLAYVRGKMGHTKEARELIKLIDSRTRDGYVPPSFRALPWIGLGEAEKAIDLLEQGCRKRDAYCVFIRHSPWTDSIRAHPRFEKLLQQLKFPD